MSHDIDTVRVQHSTPQPCNDDDHPRASVRLSLYEYLQDPTRHVMDDTESVAEIDCDTCSVSTLGCGGSSNETTASSSHAPLECMDPTHDDALSPMHTASFAVVKDMREQALQSTWEARFALKTAQEMSQVMEWWDSHASTTDMDHDSNNNDLDIDSPPLTFAMDDMPHNTLTLLVEDEEDDDDWHTVITNHTATDATVQECCESIAQLEDILSDSILLQQHQHKSWLHAWRRHKQSRKSPSTTAAVTTTISDDGETSSGDTFTTFSSDVFVSAEQLHEVAHLQKTQVDAIRQHTLHMYQSLLSLDQQVSRKRRQSSLLVQAFSAWSIKDNDNNDVSLSWRDQCHVAWTLQKQRLRHTLLLWMWDILPMTLVSPWLHFMRWVPAPIQYLVSRLVQWSILGLLVALVVQRLWLHSSTPKLSSSCTHEHIPTVQSDRWDAWITSDQVPSTEGSQWLL
jgi:hypothetical protein